ncbi:MAG: MFS transporter [Pseudomonadota bacterium]
MTDTTAKTALITPVLIGSCLILVIGFGVRSSYGVFQIPIAAEFGWPRAEFSMAIAIQNLAWGIGQPIFGALAERFGDRRALTLGVLVYVAGLVLSSFATTAAAHQFLSLLVGFGVAGTGFGVLLAIVARAASPQNRAMALAIASASGSVGQILFPPLAEGLLGVMGWSEVFLVFAVLVFGIFLVLPMLGPSAAPAARPGDAPMGRVVGQAVRDPSYVLITIGFFSCGYQLGFIIAHFPAFVTEVCGPIDPGGLLAGTGITTTSALGAIAISIIGVMNIGGTLAAGWFGSRFSKKYLLAAVYAGRTVVSALFIVMPMTPTTVILFSVLMGALWLATVPLTSGLVADIWGVQYMGTLYGLVFLSHQIGGFVGIWLGGALYDAYGTYDLVWWIGVGVGLLSVLVHLPVREGARMAPA